MARAMDVSWRDLSVTAEKGPATYRESDLATTEVWARAPAPPHYSPAFQH